MATAKIQTVKGLRVDFLLRKKSYSALDGLDRRNGVERGLSAAGRCAILEVKAQTKRRGLCYMALQYNLERGEQLWQTYNLNRARH